MPSQQGGSPLLLDTATRYDYQKLAGRSDGSVVTRGILDPITGYGATGLGMAIRLSQEARVTVPYAQSPIVYSCVRVNADALSGIPRIVWLTQDEESEPAPESDPLVKLLNKPNSLGGGRKFFRAISTALDLDGGVFLFLSHPGLQPIRPGEFPEEVWPVRDGLVTAELDKTTKLPVAWSFQIGEKKYVFPLESVARIYYPDPRNPLAAFGPMQAAWRASDHLFRAEGFDDALVENGGQIGGIFTHEEKRLDPDKVDTLSKSLKQRAQSAKSDRKHLILPAGVKFTATAFSPVDMQAKDMRKDKRDEVARIFGVPPAMLGELEDANRSSLRELRRVYYENTVIPRVEFLEEELAQAFLSILPPEFQRRWIQLDYAQTAAMREDTDAQIERIEKLVHLGVSFEDAAKIVGLDHDPIEGEDERWITTTLQPVELALEPPEPPPAPVVEAEPPAEKSYQTRRRRAAEFEEFLSKHDDAISRGAVRVFRDYWLAQRKKLREVAQVKGGELVAVRPWQDLPSARAAQWSPVRRGYAELMEMAPPRDWIQVRGASADEIEQLLLKNEQKWGEELWGALEKPIKNALFDSAKLSAKEIDAVAIRATNPRALRHMAMKRVQLTEGPMTVLAERVRLAIVRAMADAPSIGTLADRVRAVLEELESQLEVMQEQLGTRAMLIARTESAAAANAGRVAQFKASGIGTHEWVTAGDDLVREGHQIDGEQQVIGQRFSNGMSEPGEAGQPAGMVANCRCTVAPVLST